MIKAAIFDFNGTLFPDDDINIRAWKKLYTSVIGSDEGYDEMVNEIISVKNSVTIEKLFKIKGIQYNDELINETSLRKESYYHQIVLEENRKELGKGAKECLNYIKNHHLPIIMATASIRYNLDFYFEQFGLAEWFDKENSVYDDYSYKNKEEMYLEALKRLNLKGDEVILFDDSKNSIENGIRAGIKNIVRINYYDKPKMNNVEVKQEIKDFKHLDYSLFEEN